MGARRRRLGARTVAWALGFAAAEAGPAVRDVRSDVPDALQRVGAEGVLGRVVAQVLPQGRVQRKLRP